MDRGQVIANDSLSGLYRRLPAANTLLVELENAAVMDSQLSSLLAELHTLENIRQVEMEREQLKLTLAELSLTTPAVLGLLVRRGYRYSHVATERIWKRYS